MTAAATDAGTTRSWWIVEGIDFRNLGWVFLALGVMVYAIAGDWPWLLRFVHVASGVLLTGADILLGFLIGPGRLWSGLEDVTLSGSLEYLRSESNIRNFDYDNWRVQALFTKTWRF